MHTPIHSPWNGQGRAQQSVYYQNHNLLKFELEAAKSYHVITILFPSDW